MGRVPGPAAHRRQGWTPLTAARTLLAPRRRSRDGGNGRPPSGPAPPASRKVCESVGPPPFSGPTIEACPSDVGEALERPPNSPSVRRGPTRAALALDRLYNSCLEILDLGPYNCPSRPRILKRLCHCARIEPSRRPLERGGNGQLLGRVTGRPVREPTKPTDGWLPQLGDPRRCLKHDA